MSVIGKFLSTVLHGRRGAFPPVDADNAPSPEESLRVATELLEAGDEAGADEICTRILVDNPGNPEAGRLHFHIQGNGFKRIVAAQMPGPNYFDWLKWFHATVRPHTYLEIGVESGTSLQFASEPTRAVGIDPALQVIHPQQAWVKLFKLTSDDFFAQHNARQVFGGKTIDLAFIDGLHTFDQALKDFINVEQNCRANSVILIHDVLPIIPVTATRTRNTGFWLGDTWKTMLILKRMRPDLEIFTIPTFWSGLGVITRLDPSSSVLSKAFEELRDQYMALELEPMLADLGKEIRVVANSFESVDQMLAQVFLKMN